MISMLLAAGLAVAANCDLEHPSGAPGCTRASVDTLPMNAIQVIGTHNSYKLAIAPAEMALVRMANPGEAMHLDYAHPGLTVELNAGARQLELDLLNDPEGGRYADPLAMKMARDAQSAPYDFTPLKAPGLKVMHVQDLDYRSNCPTFVGCLKEIRAWSQAHPDHVPILVIMNLKEGGAGFPGATQALAFDAKAMDGIDAEIRSVFPDSALITPDKVQGKAPTLAAAVKAGGWPKLKAARGKVMFAMDEGPAKTDIYRGQRKSLEGRAMFINTDEGPAAGYVTLNEPAELKARIDAALANGLIVRTRADADTMEARANDHARQTQAFASGAQYVSTDYLKPDVRFGPYEAHLPGGGTARLNPKTGK
ncbi:phosphatidylinositol-specific phospholipase C1-like protein [Phenylobacterium sp. 20VBR1]|uniref:Phosphatidylinositol-specific phospholipase C1-like protein n=1 Tax=Phenylobacterium glaciei TaxID=2803784 RepID=A0A941CZB0_9CAUL|nr:phosphatidylinositol-specific phospholipase C1-like protein [Phenylobacterium glaciei]MBR7619062.1 phosphatidylinositol-specific phospholipase C1-like protein [Phenylobacterium glaciei]